MPESGLDVWANESKVKSAKYQPELKSELVSKQSLEQAADILQNELLEKQAMHASVHDEVARLRAKLDDC